MKYVIANSKTVKEEGRHVFSHCFHQPSPSSPVSLRSAPVTNDFGRPGGNNTLQLVCQKKKKAQHKVKHTIVEEKGQHDNNNKQQKSTKQLN